MSDAIDELKKLTNGKDTYICKNIYLVGNNSVIFSDGYELFKFENNHIFPFVLENEKLCLDALQKIETFLTTRELVTDGCYSKNNCEPAKNINDFIKNNFKEYFKNFDGDMDLKTPDTQSFEDDCESDDLSVPSIDSNENNLTSDKNENSSASQEDVHEKVDVEQEQRCQNNKNNKDRWNIFGETAELEKKETVVEKPLFKDGGGDDENLDDIIFGRCQNLMNVFETEKDRQRQLKSSMKALEKKEKELIKKKFDMIQDKIIKVVGNFGTYSNILNAHKGIASENIGVPDMFRLQYEYFEKMTEDDKDIIKRWDNLKILNVSDVSEFDADILRVANAFNAEWKDKIKDAIVFEHSWKELESDV